VTAGTDPTWWRDAVVYELYVRSYADSDGDGVGDLEGIRQRLGHLAALGVDAVWLTPFYPSPMADHGYDVADPRDVEPLFGDLDAFDRLVADAGALGLRVIVDVVPNHSSSLHAWFQAALAAAPGSPERDRYVFRDGTGPDGAEPPNNWSSVFGGPAWTRVPDGQWYLHLFAPEQPDLNWANPEVGDDYERTLRFWLGRGASGFRIDVAHGLVKADGLPDARHPEVSGLLDESRVGDPRWDQDGVHDVYRRWRRVLDEYPGAMSVGEIWVHGDEALARYVRPDELHTAFNFGLLLTGWDPRSMRQAIEGSIATLAALEVPSTWVLSNHDRPRHVTRYGDGEVGRRRARAAALLLLALPGTAYVYQGEELGLPEVDLPDEVLQDPIWRRSGHTERGRDGCRVPLPWSGGESPFGFSPDGADAPWLPMPADWKPFTVEAQEGDPGSMLTLYRTALALRRQLLPLAPDGLEWTPSSESVLVFRRGTWLCAINLGEETVALPTGEVLLASGPLPDWALPPDTAAWVRTA
jgi:alpha-glucosidase